jgi:hypothetical protein
MVDEMIISKEIKFVKFKITPPCDQVKRFDCIEAFLFSSPFSLLSGESSIADAGSLFGAKPARLWVTRG